MGTRSVIATPYGDSWRGRYCHWDGYPTHMGETLWALVARDGLETVRRVLTEEHYGWSNLSLKQGPEFDDVHATMYGDGRFAPVGGYGVAYTDTIIPGMGENGKPYQQVTEDAWHTPDEDDWTEWFYVLADDGLWVGRSGRRGAVAIARWDSPEPDWEFIEQKGETVA